MVHPMTDSMFEIIDKLVVAQLKAVKFGEEGMTAEEGNAEELVKKYSEAGNYYLDKIANGMAPEVKKRLRYHDHGKVEGKWVGKRKEIDNPKSAMHCIALLAEIHFKYWGLQSKINGLKALLLTSPTEDDRNRINDKMVNAQRELDLCNQWRNDLIQRGDEMIHGEFC